MSRGDEDAFDSLEIIDLEPASTVESTDRPRSPGARGSRWPAIVALVVVVGLVISVVAGRSHHHGTSAASASTSDATKAVIRLHGGGLFSFRVGARVLTAGDDGLRVVDTDTGSIGVPAIRGLPPGPVTLVASSGTTVAVRVNGQMFWFTLTDGVAHHVQADSAFAAAEPGYVWFANEFRATEVPGGPSRLHRAIVTTDAPAIGATRRGLLEQTAERGYLLQSTTSAGAARPFLPPDATVIGVHRDRVAWLSTQDCGVLRCPVHVTEVASGATTSWIQLVNHPDPIALAGTVAYFEPDGSRLAIVVPDNNITRATSMELADLHTKHTQLISTTGYITAPARPGTDDGAGATVAWTADGAYVVLAPAAGTGDGRLAVVDPETASISSARVTLDLGASAGVIGDSTIGALPPTTRPGRFGPIATDDRPPPRAGLHLVAADDGAVDVLDLHSFALRTIAVGGYEPNPAGPRSIARVTGGWLVVRSNGIVDLIRDGASEAKVVDAGTQVFAAAGGRDAWIARSAPGGQWRAETYDPQTGAIGILMTTAKPVAAVDDGLVVVRTDATSQTLSLVDASGRTQLLTTLHAGPIAVAGSGGNTVLFSDQVELRRLDVTTRVTTTIGDIAGADAAISPDGLQLAWIGDGDELFSQSLTGNRSVTRIGRATRVRVADDGTIVATDGETVYEGRVGETGLQRYDGLSPAVSAELALG